MLDPLLGSQTIQKILLFLLVNGKCYGNQLHRMLHIPLTPIQKALLKLEKGGVIASFFEGKTRIYQFNASYPLLNELEQLLKKAYTLLPQQEKKRYLYVNEGERFPQYSKKEIDEILLYFWGLLGNVNELTFHAKSKTKQEGGWNGKGSGDVVITRERDAALIYTEKGAWVSEMGEEHDFTNIFRWTLDRALGVISLEHLRRGPNHPVFLFHLAPTNQKTLASIDSHLCCSDSYFGKVFSEPHHLRLHWRVIGPKKNEVLDYYYSSNILGK